MLILAENTEDTFRLSLIKKNQFRPLCTNARFLPVTATHNIQFTIIKFYMQGLISFPEPTVNEAL